MLEGLSAPARATRSAGGTARTLAFRWLGQIDYARALELQARLVKKRRGGEIPDTLLLLEHPHVITLGSTGRRSDVLVSADDLKAREIDIHRAGRGGEVTYHGPGQLVGYPVLDLKPDRTDLHQYLRSLEDVLIWTLRALGVNGTRGSATGVWVEGAKVGAIGIRVSSGWITSHGFALNASTNLEYFRTIVPCGAPEQRVTSVSELLGRQVTPEDVAPRAIKAMMHVFGYGSVCNARR